MAIAKTVQNYLQKYHVPYSVVAHPRTLSCKETAQAAHVPAERIAKAVVFTDRGGYVMAVIPGNRHVGVEELSRELGRQLSLAAETRIAPVFTDCDLGAIPPIGPAYGIETILDQSLAEQPEIYFEAGDHEELICMKRDQFMMLLKEAGHGNFSD
jgi:Ala-tRNA(Pro) deacylase